MAAKATLVTIVLWALLCQNVIYTKFTPKTLHHAEKPSKTVASGDEGHGWSQGQVPVTNLTSSGRPSQTLSDRTLVSLATLELVTSGGVIHSFRLKENSGSGARNFHLGKVHLPPSTGSNTLPVVRRLRVCALDTVGACLVSDDVTTEDNDVTSSSTHLNGRSVMWTPKMEFLGQGHVVTVLRLKQGTGNDSRNPRQMALSVHPSTETTDAQTKRFRVCALNANEECVVSCDVTVHTPPSRASRSVTQATATRIFVLPLNASGDLFSVASVPAVADESYDFRQTRAGMAVDAGTGMVSVSSPDWHQGETKVELFFSVTSPQGTTQLDVTVIRVERGPYSDLFTNGPTPLMTGVPEWIRPGKTVYQLRAKDAEQHGATVVYRLESGGQGRFEVDAERGEVRTLQRLPFGPLASFELAVSCQVLGTAPTSTTFTQVLRVRTGDILPQFDRATYVIDMDEFDSDTVPDAANPIAEISVHSFYDLPVTFTVATNQLADGSTPVTKFKVDTKAKVGTVSTGVLLPVPGLTAISALTDPRQYRLTVTAKEETSGFTATAKVIVNVIDINDHAPMFLSDVYERYNVAEDVAVGTSMLTVLVVDRDEGVNADLVFEVDDDHFRVDKNDNRSATIFTDRSFDYDVLPMGWYEFNVTATDQGTPNKTGRATVRVRVVNINDKSPVFDPPHQMAYVRQKLPSGSLVHVVQAHDPDGEMSPFTFGFQGSADGKYGMFTIDRTSGEIRLTETFPEDKMEKVELPVTLNDGKNPVTTGNITVDIMGINRPPSIPGCTAIRPVVKEAQGQGTLVVVVNATDPDSGSNGELAFYLTGSNNERAFTLSQIGPNSAELRTKVTFDREDPVSPYTYYRIADDIKYPVTVEVRDNNGNERSLSTTCFFFVTLEDVNNKRPVFDNDDTFSGRNIPFIPNRPAVNQRIFRVFAIDRDLGTNAEVTYNLRNLNCEDCLKIDSQKGYIMANKDFPDGTDTLIYAEVSATDQVDPPTLLNITLRRSDSFKVPQWNTVGGVDLDDYILQVKEDAGPGDNLEPRLSVTADNDLNFLFPKGEFRENNKEDTFTSKPVEGAKNTINLVKKIAKQDGGRDPLRYIKLRANDYNAGDAETQPYSDKRLKIRFIDVNLNAPQFAGQDNQEQYPAYVSTESQMGDTVANVFAFDEDSTATYNTVQYVFSDSCPDCAGNFALDATTGEVKTARKFDRANEQNVFRLSIYARDGKDFPQECASGTTTNCFRRSVQEARVTVNLARPISDRPFFTQATYTQQIDEGFYPKKNLVKITAEYRGIEVAQVQHSILSGNEGHVFAVEQSSGQIYQVGELDYKKKQEYALTLGVFHGELSNQTSLTFRIQEKPCLRPHTFQIDGELPVFSKSGLTEHQTNPTLVVTIAPVPGINYQLTGPLADNFRIENNGQVHMKRGLDRDDPLGYSEWQVNVEAVCSLNPPPGDATRAYAIVSLKLDDINDNSPVFNTGTLEGSVLENQGAITSVMKVQATDADVGVNAEVQYTMEDDADGKFSIDETTGVISTKQQLDRERVDRYQIKVKANDKGPPTEGSKPVTQFVWISVADDNDHRPRFPGARRYDVTVPENQPIGASVLSVLAEDPDVGDNARRDYSTDEPRFYMDSIRATGAGVIKVKEILDYETLPVSKSISFKVSVKGPKPNDVDTCDVTVHVTDVNDNAPVVCPKGGATVAGKCPVVPSAECPSGATAQVREDREVDFLVAEFTGCDEDEGKNAEFSFSIDSENTDPNRKFKVEQVDDKKVRVRLRSQVDREKVDHHVVHILATDKGDPPLTGTSTLTVVVGDINDHAPEFADPEVLRVVRAKTSPGVLVGEWAIIDRDSAENGPPFSVRHDDDDEKFRRDFTWTYENEKLYVRTSKSAYTRTATFKRYVTFFTLKDSGSPAMEARRELRVEIEDLNDHPHAGATKYVSVFSHQGLFNEVILGHIYASDVDDWDRTEKTYSLVSAPKGFSLNSAAPWELKMSRGVDPTVHQVAADVKDRYGTQRSYVNVDVDFVYDDAIHSSGSLRIQGVSAEGLVERPAGQGTSRLDTLREQIKTVVGATSRDSVHVIHVRRQADDVTDVYYYVTAPGPKGLYLRSTRLDGNVWLNKEQIGKALGNVEIKMAPINECSGVTCWQGSCTNRLVIDSVPVTVNTNVTSHVGINVTYQASCTCDATTIPPEPEVCTATTCLNGGTCTQTWANANCTCPEGFEGPRCQKLKRHFGGTGWAWFQPLYLCGRDLIRFEFATAASGRPQLLLYSGPLRQGDSPHHVIVQLKADGYPQLSVNTGSGPAGAAITGMDGGNQRKQPPLNDGAWHTIDVTRKGQDFWMTVDYCKTSTIREDWNLTQEDRKACEVKVTAPGDDLAVTFSAPLQLGGRKSSDVPLPDGFGDGGLQGCMKNVFHNGEIYDLYVGTLGQGANTTEDCPPEGGATSYDIMAFSTYDVTASTAYDVIGSGRNQTCVSDLVGGDPQCTCTPGRRGQGCMEATTTRDFMTNKAFLEWDMQASDNRKEFLQLSFRSRTTDAMLFFAESDTTLERCFLQVVSSRLTFTYDLGSGDKVMSLPSLNVSDGLWHTVSIGRHGNQVIMTVDGGEGRYYTENEAVDDFRQLMLKGKVFGGADVTYRRFHADPTVADSMEKSWFTDVRFSPDENRDAWLAMTTSLNDQSAGKLRSDRTKDVSIGPVPDPPCDVTRCSSGQTCLDVWRVTYCGCLQNQSTNGDRCRDRDDCSVVVCAASGTCVPQLNLSGICYYPPPEVFSARAALAPTALGIIIGALLLMLLLLLLSTLIRTRKTLPPEPMEAPFANDLENHTRDNLAFYSEEGIGEELPATTDFRPLRMYMNGHGPPPEPLAVEAYLGDAVGDSPYDEAYPSYDKDVGDLIMKNKMATDDDKDYPPDHVTTFEHEGSASLATSLSSLQSGSGTGNDDDDQDYRYLNDWGPRFRKLADLYGADVGSDASSDTSGGPDNYPARVLGFMPGDDLQGTNPGSPSYGSEQADPQTGTGNSRPLSLGFQPHLDGSSGDPDTAFRPYVGSDDPLLSRPPVGGAGEANRSRDPPYARPEIPMAGQSSPNLSPRGGGRLNSTSPSPIYPLQGQSVPNGDVSRPRFSYPEHLTLPANDGRPGDVMTDSPGYSDVSNLSPGQYIPGYGGPGPRFGDVSPRFRDVMQHSPDSLQDDLNAAYLGQPDAPRIPLRGYQSDYSLA